MENDPGWPASCGHPTLPLHTSHSSECFPRAESEQPLNRRRPHGSDVQHCLQLRPATTLIVLTMNWLLATDRMHAWGKFQHCFNQLWLVFECAKKIWPSPLVCECHWFWYCRALFSYKSEKMSFTFYRKGAHPRYKSCLLENDARIVLPRLLE